MTLLLLSIIFILWAKNPMHAVLGLIIVYINSAILLLSLKIDFIALTFVVVYVGAIAVLFLFVIMLLNLRSTELVNKNSFKNELFPYLLACILTLILYLYDISSNDINYLSYQVIGDVIAQADLTSFIPIYLFTNPIQLLLLIILLLLAIIGPIALASKQHTHIKKQDLFYALTRETNTVTLINESNGNIKLN